MGGWRGICRIRECCNEFVLPENLTNTALGYVPFHTFINTVYCGVIFTDISVVHNVFYSRVLSSSSVLQCHNYGYLLVRNVFRSTISSPSSVSQCHGYLFSPECFLH